MKLLFDVTKVATTLLCLCLVEKDLQSNRIYLCCKLFCGNSRFISLNKKRTIQPYNNTVIVS